MTIDLIFCINNPIQPKLAKTKRKTIKFNRKFTNIPQKLSKSAIIKRNKKNPYEKIGPFQQGKEAVRTLAWRRRKEILRAKTQGDLG